MASGILPACVAAMLLMVWGLGHLPVGQAGFLRTRQNGGPSTAVAPLAGIYIISATVDPSGGVETVNVNRNGVMFFTVKGHHCICNAAMATRLEINDTITVTGTGFHRGECNRFSMALLTDGNEGTSYSSVKSLEDREYNNPVTFGKQYLIPTGWVPYTLDYVEAQATGMHWIMARINAEYFYYSSFTVGWGQYDAFTVWSDEGQPVSASGAFQLERGQRVQLRPHRTDCEDCNLRSNSILSVVCLPHNEGKAFTTRLWLPVSSRCASVIAARARQPSINRPIHGGKRATMRRTAENQREGHRHGRASNVAAPHLERAKRLINSSQQEFLLKFHQPMTNSAMGEGHRHGRASNVAAPHLERAKRLINSSQQEFLLKFHQPMTTSAMGESGGSIITIMTHGTYLIGIRPDPGSRYTLDIAMYTNGDFTWRTYAQGTTMGETFALFFNTYDRLEFLAENSCFVEYGTFVSVAFVQ